MRFGRRRFRSRGRRVLSRRRGRSGKLRSRRLRIGYRM